jgi:hypothetical protein
MMMRLNVVSALFQVLYPVLHLLQSGTNQAVTLDLHQHHILVMKLSVLQPLIYQYDPFLLTMKVQQVI